MPDIREAYKQVTCLQTDKKGFLKIQQVLNFLNHQVNLERKHQYEMEKKQEEEERLAAEKEAAEFEKNQKKGGKKEEA